MDPGDQRRKLSVLCKARKSIWRHAEGPTRAFNLAEQGQRRAEISAREARHVDGKAIGRFVIGFWVLRLDLRERLELIGPTLDSVYKQSEGSKKTFVLYVREDGRKKGQIRLVGGKIYIKRREAKNQNSRPPIHR